MRTRLAASLRMRVSQSLLVPHFLVLPNKLVQSNIYSVRTLDTSHRRRGNFGRRPNEDEWQVRRDERGHADPVRVRGQSLANEDRQREQGLT